MVTIQVFYAVLPFSVDGFVEILDDLCACRFCCVEVRIDILDEDGQALRFAAQLRWRLRVRTRAHEHDPCITEMHLRATDRFSVTIVLRESEYLREPGDRFRNVLIDDMRQHGILSARSDCSTCAERITASGNDATGTLVVRWRKWLLRRETVVLNGEAIGYGKDGGIGLCAGEDCKTNGYGAFAGIVSGDGEIGLEICGVPELFREREGLIVSNDAGCDGCGLAGADCRKIADRLISNALASEETLPVIVGAAWLNSGR
jgi:hypothetical protein